jgi:Fic-DOC domain mobile mystery protein B
MDITTPQGATPLDPDEAAGLLPQHITTQADLNAWEEANILQGEVWAKRQTKRDLLTEGFVRDLHSQMFSRTWRWAGTFRSSNKNIGVDWAQVATRLRNLLDNTRYQIDHTPVAGNSAECDALAMRFHHQLVWIHPFPNGNGRHARLLADTLALRLGQARFTWGSASLETIGDARARYLQALRAADAGSMDALIEFARS